MQNILTTTNLLKQASTNKRPIHTVRSTSHVSTGATTMPTSFDGRIHWAKQLPLVYDQGTCGSCWAIASVNILESRINLMSAVDEPLVRLSTQKALLCNWEEAKIDAFYKHTPETRQSILQERKTTRIDTYAIGCNKGTTLTDGLEYAYRFGVPSTGCVPDNRVYNACPDSLSDSTQACVMCEDVISNEFDTCTDGTSALFNYTACVVYLIDTLDEYRLVKRDILQFGPIGVSAFVHSSFMSYSGKTLYDNPYINETMDATECAGHMMIIVGWRTDVDVGVVWLVQNSWGVAWGDDGYGWISARSLRTWGKEEGTAYIYGAQYGSVLPNFGTIPTSKTAEYIRMDKSAYTLEENDITTSRTFADNGIPKTTQAKVDNGQLDPQWIDTHRKSVDIDITWAHYPQSPDYTTIILIVVICVLVLIMISVGVYLYYKKQKKV